MTAAYMLERDGLDQLFAALRERGFRLVGPVLRDGAIGKVSPETAAPGSGAIVVQTIGGGEVSGFPWLLEPHRRRGGVPGGGRG